ncbi:MAG: spermidine/putrescine ABC transporter substrate-binding protein [Phototrophicales bacterium]
MRKLFLLILVLLIPVFAVSAQDDEQDEQDTMEMPEITWECPEEFEGQTLNVYNWATYIGETTISDFEELCGVDVIYDVYDTNESLIARMRLGNPGYDIAFPSDYAVSIMVNDGLLQPIDLEKIPNFANVAEQWVGLDFDPDNQYSVPYLWGSQGIGYNVEAVGEEITSWYQVFEYDGPVAWLNDARGMLSVALNLLGYDPNSADPDEIQEAADFLLENSDNVIVLAADDGEALLERGEADIVVEYNGDIFQVMLNCECDDYSYVIPDEGSTVFVDVMVILKDAPNPDLAHVFIDYILDPVVNAQIVNTTGYASPSNVPLEMGLIDPTLAENPAIYVPEEKLENVWFLQDTGDAEVYYSDAWEALTIFIGE